MVGEIYAPHLDKHGHLPRRSRYSADRYMQDVKAVTKKLQERPDFQNMLNTITVEEAVSLASSPNARRLAVRLGGFTRSMPAETMTAVQNTVNPMLHKQETKTLGNS